MGDEVEKENTGHARELEISFGSHLGYLDLVQELSDKISLLVGFDEDARYWIGLSVRESVTNAVHHGNELDEEKKVGVRFESWPDRLVIYVQDEGEGFEESDVPNALDPENLLKPSGRGIFYVRSFMDEVCYEILPEGGCEMRMEKRLNNQKQGDGNEN
ncbi:MAG: ATP-binding protein [Acidobacteriota bacterium]